MNYYFEALKKYTDFSGRARRREFWVFVLVNTVIFGILLAIGVICRFPTEVDVFVLPVLFSLVVLLPTLAVTARRLHDTNHRGWFMLLGFAAGIGLIFLLIMLFTDSEKGKNHFGPSPKS